MYAYIYIYIFMAKSILYNINPYYIMVYIYIYKPLYRMDLAINDQQ